MQPFSVAVADSSSDVDAITSYSGVLSKQQSGVYLESGILYTKALEIYFPFQAECVYQ